MLEAILNWAREIPLFSTWADIVGIGGVLVAIIGVFRAKSAAQRAAQAAEDARSEIRAIQTLVDFSSAISTFEELKRLHRAGAWPILPDRYSAARKLLIMLRRSDVKLSEDQEVVLQEAIQGLADLEKTVEKSLADGRNPPKADKLNAGLSRHVDNLIAVFEVLKTADQGSEA